MKQIKKYKYNGRNGSIISSVLIDGASKINMFYLAADEGKILTNGEKFYNSVYIYADEIDNWTEVDNIGQN